MNNILIILELRLRGTIRESVTESCMMVAAILRCLKMKKRHAYNWNNETRNYVWQWCNTDRPGIKRHGFLLPNTFLFKDFTYQPNGNFSRVTGFWWGNLMVTGEPPPPPPPPPKKKKKKKKRPVMRSFVVFFALRLNTRLSKQLRLWYYDAPCSIGVDKLFIEHNCLVQKCMMYLAGHWGWLYTLKVCKTNAQGNTPMCELRMTL